MTDPSSSGADLPTFGGQDEQPLAQVLHLACPACNGELTLEPAHVGVEGFCPECLVPIIARSDPSGQVAVHRLGAEPAATPPASPAPQGSPPPPPRPSVGGTVLQTRSGFFVEARPLRRPSGLVLGLSFFLVLVAILVAGGVSLRRSGELFNFTRSESIVPVPVPLATAPMERSAPPAATAEPVPPPPPEVKAAPPAAAPQTVEDPRNAILAAAARKTVRDFLTAARPWEKLVHVLEPEEDLLSILEFKDLDPLAADAEIRELKTIRVEAERRWVSLATVPERNGIMSTLCLVHREDNGSAKLDFSLYWQNRADLLTPFAAGEPKKEPLTLRVHLRRLPEATSPTVDFASPPLRFALSQAYSSFAPVAFPVSAATPLAAELSARTTGDATISAIVELHWTPSETDPTQPYPTIHKVIQWGIWAANE